MSGAVYIGPAGWSYPDWKGIVYPGGRVEELRFIAGLFDAVEVNTSFYRPPSPRTVRSWLDQVKDNPRFLFTFKLYRGFTHQPDVLRPDDEQLFKEGVQPVREAGRLGALLLQFPYSFRNTPENKALLADLLDRFRDYPLVVEFRRRQWDTPGVLESLTRRNAGFCNVDQPLISENLPLTCRVTSPVAYLRLHGRNGRNWFREGAGAQRYNYLYSEEEITALVPLVRDMEERAGRVFVITNNHLGGQSVINGLQLVRVMRGSAPPPPPTLLARYPHLVSFFSPPEEEDAGQG